MKQKIRIVPWDYNVEFGLGYKYGQKILINDNEPIDWDSQIDVELFEKLLKALNVEYELEHYDHSW